ncbi:phage replisome organizer N-terminal domain-containing protein [Neobacillus vireti]|uniref:phage replisome organizer N-terminal domain-containing protein n=1 Tax=Neobacillus vireti TaxID=220686 RepID=UPI002FFDA43C
MTEVKWIKLSVNMFEDEKVRLIESLPEADTILIIWIKLLAQAGKTNASGYIFLNEHIPYTDEMLSTIFNRPIGTVRLALKTFEQFGMIEINDDHFISITNWEKHQNIDGLEKIRQQTKKRVAEHRQRKKETLLESPSNVTVTRGNETEVEVEVDKEKEFTTTTTLENPVVLFERLLCRLSPIQSDKLFQWVDDFNGISEIVNEAIIIADNKNKRYFGFVEFLLKEWSNNNLKSLDRIKAYEQEKFNKQKSVRTGTSKKGSLFEQGEESKKRQAAIKPLSPEEMERLKRLEDELPY